jgi:hypothetical protein
MIYVIFPHDDLTWNSARLFTSYSAMEQAVLIAARGFKREGYDPDWCFIVAYDGVDELHPIFLYTIVNGIRLQRQAFPSPSP